MPRRRRPLRRAAVTGAVGYTAYNKGKKSAETEAQAPPPQPPSQAQPQDQRTSSSPETPASRLEIYDQIAKLGELKERGLLTDAEFEREKIRLLD